MWDAETGEQEATLRGHTDVVQSIAWHPQGSVLGLLNGVSALAIGEKRAANGERAFIVVKRIRANLRWDFALRAFATASCSSDLSIKLWDFSSVGAQPQPPAAPPASPSGSGSGSNAVHRCTHTLRGHEHTVSSVVFLGDGARLASCSRDRSIKIWELATGSARSAV